MISNAFRRRLLVVTFTCCIAMLPVHSATAAISYDNSGDSYTQDFNSLPTVPTTGALEGTGTNQFANGWQDDTTTIAGNRVSIPGWYLYHDTAPASENGTNDHQRFRVSTGNQNTGAFYSFGIAGTNPVSDRALGNLTSNTIDTSYYGVRLTNNSGVTLEKFTLQYAAEQWRDQNTAVQSVPFSYAITDSSPTNIGLFNATSNTGGIPGTNITNVETLGFSSIKNTNSGALDGNAAANRTTISATVLGISWAPGQDLWLRWSDVDHAGNDHGMGIDDLTFSANVMPTPTWIGAADSDWNNTSNWDTGVVPGSDGIAVFDNAGNDNTSISLGGTRPIGIIRFNAGAAAYTLGSSSEQFDVDNGGAIRVASGVTAPQTINANLNALGALPISNSSTNAAARLNIGSGVTNNNGLAVDGPGAVSFNGVISGGGALTNTSTGKIALNAQNTFSGGTTINMLTTTQGTVLVGSSTVGSPGSITSGPFGTGTLTLTGAGPAIFIPVGADITVANDWGTPGSPVPAGMFVATGSATDDPTGPHDITFTGNKYTTGGRVFTNNIAAGATLTWGDPNSPGTITRDNNFTLQSQVQVQPGGGTMVINDNLAASTGTNTTLTIQNGLKLTMNGTIGGNGNVVVQASVVPGTVVRFNKTGMYTGTGNVNITTGATAHFDQPNVFGTATGVAGILTTNGLGTTVYVDSELSVGKRWNIENDAVVYVNAPTTFSGTPSNAAMNIQGSNARAQTAMVVNSTVTKGPGAGSGLRVATGTLAGNGGTIFSEVGILHSDNGPSYLAPGTPAISGGDNMTPAYQNGPGLLTIGAPENPFPLDFANTSNCANCNFYFELGGATPGTGYDQVVVNGTATIGGASATRGNLTVALINDFNPAPGSSFEILHATSLVQGFGTGFTTITLPDPEWTLRWESTGLFVDVPLATEDGDWNDDGVIDILDYVVWRMDPVNNGGDPEGYQLWAQNFGNPSPGGGSSSAVPEPTSILLVIAALFGLSAATGTRRRA